MATIPPAVVEIRLVLDALLDPAASDEERLDRIEEVRAWLHSQSPVRSQPIDRVRWVPIEQVEANNYNPNAVASREMRLLYTSILHDGYTQPVVTIFDSARGKYVIVDGFHRYFTCKSNPDLLARNRGRLPVVVIDKEIADRMASTVRHNRARGKHSVTGMSQMVFSLLDSGWPDEQICNHLGMEPEELLKLKHLTGFARLFEDAEYAQAWMTRSQIRIAKGLPPDDAPAPVRDPAEGEDEV